MPSPVAHVTLPALITLSAVASKIGARSPPRVSCFRYTKAWVKRGRLHSDGGNFEEAVSDFKEAVEVDEDGDEGVHQLLREAKLDLKKSKRKNYYKILGLDEGCDNAVLIKKAYRKQAMKYHPDRKQGDAAKAQGAAT